MPTQNNGKLASQTDNVSGEQVVYAYDALNRLASATATSGSWGQELLLRRLREPDGPECDRWQRSGVFRDSRPDHESCRLGGCERQHPGLGRSGPGNADHFRRVRRGESVHRHRSLVFLLQWLSILLYAPGNKRVWRGNFSTNGGAPDIDHRRSNLLERQWSETGEL